MKQLTLLVKPASSMCNMRCKYCFYQDEAAKRKQHTMGIMTYSTAAALIQRAMSYIGEGGSLSVVFQGGEPTLAGIDFFRYFTQTADCMLPKGAVIRYAIQTNGYELPEELLSIWKQYRFLVGISMDGFRLLHDRWRIDAAGNGTWQTILRNLKRLQAMGIDTNALCVITAQAAGNPEKIYRTLKQLGFRHQQYIPCLDPLKCQRGSTAFSLRPDAYGQFLKTTFDLWYSDWKRKDYVSIRTFEDYVMNAMGQPCSSCGNSGTCGHYLLIEADGTAYPCDFYALDEWRLGNIHTDSMETLMYGKRATQFRSQRNPIPAECVQCPYQRLCRSGCFRDWETGANGPYNYYCESFRAFVPYAASRILEVAKAEKNSRYI